MDREESKEVLPQDWVQEGKSRKKKCVMELPAQT